jgi:hypothetical protein
MELSPPAAGLLGLFALGVAFAGPCAATPSCEPSLFPQKPDVESAMVIAPKLSVFHDPEACSRPSGLCPTNAYLLHGDRVVAAQAANGFRCVAFIGPSRQTTGWVSIAGLVSIASPPEGDWSGTWVRRLGDATLVVSLQHGRRIADFQAFAHGSDPSNVRTGGADGILNIIGERAHLTSRSDPSCRVDVRRLGTFLIVSDGASDDANSPCGGMGVSLNGVYVRKAH